MKKIEERERAKTDKLYLATEVLGLAPDAVQVDCPYPVNQCKEINPDCPFHENVRAVDINKFFEGK